MIKDVIGDLINNGIGEPDGDLTGRKLDDESEKETK